MKKKNYRKVDPCVASAAVGMVKDGYRCPTIARILKRPVDEIQGNLGMWVHWQMQGVEGRAFSAYRQHAAAKLSVGHQTVMEWHYTFLIGCQKSECAELQALASEEYQHQTPTVRAAMDLHGRRPSSSS